MSDRGSVRVTPDAFVRELLAEVERHPAVAHSFLRRFAEGGPAPWPIWAMPRDTQLVCFFTAYLEAIAGRTPDPEVRRTLRDIREDKYMRRTPDAGGSGHGLRSHTRRDPTDGDHGPQDAFRRYPAESPGGFHRGLRNPPGEG